MPLFDPPSQPAQLSGAAASPSQHRGREQSPDLPMPVSSPPHGWPERTVQSLCRALRIYGQDWEAVALGIGSNPLACERFYRQYEQFVPGLRAAVLEHRLHTHVGQCSCCIRVRLF